MAPFLPKLDIRIVKAEKTLFEDQIRSQQDLAPRRYSINNRFGIIQDDAKSSSVLLLLPPQLLLSMICEEKKEIKRKRKRIGGWCKFL